MHQTAVVTQKIMNENLKLFIRTFNNQCPYRYVGEMISKNLYDIGNFYLQQTNTDFGKTCEKIKSKFRAVHTRYCTEKQTKLPF